MSLPTTSYKFTTKENTTGGPRYRRVLEWGEGVTHSGTGPFLLCSPGAIHAYESLYKCLEKVAEAAKLMGASVHMPRIGCGLAGGHWDVVASLVEDTMSGVEVTVYDLPQEVRK